MKTVLFTTMCAAAALLGGCAAEAPAPAVPAAGQVAAAGNAARDDTITGSRLTRRSTDRMVKTVGSQDARDALTAQPRPMSSSGSGE